MSVSALRFYGECGLIEPRAVDDATGYRYYADDQVELAILVRGLRAAEMPIEAIRRFLEAPLERRHQLLDEHSLLFTSRLEGLRRSVEELRGLLEENPMLAFGPACVVRARELAMALEQVSFAVPADDERPELNGVLLEAREDALRLVATDAYRLAIRDVAAAPGSAGGGATGLVTPKQLALLVGRWRDNGPELTVALRGRGDGMLCAELAGELAELGMSRQRFPDYEQLLASLPSGEGRLVERRALFEALGTDDLPTWLLLEQGSVAVERAGERSRLPASGGGEERRALVNPRFLREALERLGGPDVAVEVADSLHPVVLRSVDSGTLTIWTMPIRPDDGA